MKASITAVFAFTIMVCLGFLSHAQSPASPVQAPAVAASPAPAASPVVAPAAPATPPVVSTIGALVDKIPGSLSATVLAIIAFLIELLMRFVPTAKPRSLFILVGSIFSLLGQGFSKLSQLLDQIVQNLKDPTP